MQELCMVTWGVHSVCILAWVLLKRYPISWAYHLCGKMQNIDRPERMKHCKDAPCCWCLERPHKFCSFSLIIATQIQKKSFPVALGFLHFTNLSIHLKLCLRNGENVIYCTPRAEPSGLATRKTSECQYFQ